MAWCKNVGQSTGHVQLTALQSVTGGLQCISFADTESTQAQDWTGQLGPLLVVERKGKHSSIKQKIYEPVQQPTANVPAQALGPNAVVPATHSHSTKMWRNQPSSQLTRLPWLGTTYSVISINGLAQAPQSVTLAELKHQAESGMPVKVEYESYPSWHSHSNRDRLDTAGSGRATKGRVCASIKTPVLVGYGFSSQPENPCAIQSRTFSGPFQHRRPANGASLKQHRRACSHARRQRQIWLWCFGWTGVTAKHCSRVENWAPKTWPSPSQHAPECLWGARLAVRPPLGP